MKYGGALLAIALLLGACGRTTTLDAEAVIGKVFALCQTQRYRDALDLFTYGAELWETDPATAKFEVDRLCGSQKSKSYSFIERDAAKEAVEYRVQVYADEAQQNKSYTLKFTLILRKGRWLIAELR